MVLDITGRLSPDAELRIGYIGCGSHSFRNIYPTLQFVPVQLVSVCSRTLEKAQAFARKFGAENACTDYRRMLEQDKLDAVFVVTGYENGHSTHSRIAMDCLAAGCHVWMEKPAPESSQEMRQLADAAAKAGKHVVCGFKKMFSPANEKAKELIQTDGFGKPSLVTLQYPQGIPSLEEFQQYLHQRQNVESVKGFIDHICHPLSILVDWLGLPQSLYYERSWNTGGVATFRYSDGTLASLILNKGASHTGSAERSVIYSNQGRHIEVENNLRVYYHQSPPGLRYGAEPSFYKGGLGQTTASWYPEFSLGQLYNKGLALQGFMGEVIEFVDAVRQNRPPRKGGLDDMMKVTRIVEAFAQGEKKQINV
ncbi:MAG: Gfo/Idh/MocA family oxidoreductase [Phycisphaeraceae bacterium]